MRDGIICIDKPAEHTSFDVIARVRGILHMKKVGHAGTLDPMTTGVLPVFLGRATKAAELLTGSQKQYEAELLFGQETDTQDLSGHVTRQASYDFRRERFMQAIEELTGDIWQVPPMYSALKVGGVRLYDLAREGIEVERKPRQIRIEEIQVLALDEKGARIRVTCSKGTYIRTLCEDIGRKTGWLACMSSLCRLRSGPFTLEDSLTLDQIRSLKDQGKLEERILSVDRIFAKYEGIQIEEAQEKRLQNGNTLLLSAESAIGERIRVYNSQGHFTALYQVSEVLEDGARLCKIEKMY